MKFNGTGNAETVEATHEATQRKIVTISQPQIVAKMYKLTEMYNPDFPPSASAVVQKLFSVYSVEEIYQLIQVKSKKGAD